MRILAFLNAYTEGKSGGDMCFIEIFKRLKKRKLTVVTSLLGKKLCIDHNLHADFEITTSEKKFQFILFTYFLRIIKGSWIAITSQKYDVLYITSDALPDVLPAFLYKIIRPKTKCIAKIFHIIPSTRILSSLGQQISHAFLKICADTTIVDSELVKKSLINEGFWARKITISYPAIDTTFLSKIKPIKKYTATFMARLHESKGIFDLVEIWSDVAVFDSKSKLAIIGIGDEKTTNKLIHLIHELRLEDNIDLLGFLPDEKAYSLIKGSDVFVFPSHEEGFGIVVGEALALEVPVVAYNLPVFAETFIDVISSVETYNQKEFVKKIITIISKPKKYQQTTKIGKKLVEKFSWETAAQIEQQLL